MGRPKGRKVSPVQASKKYRENPENKLKVAAYEKLRCERRKLARIENKIGKGRGGVVKIKVKQVRLIVK